VGVEHIHAAELFHAPPDEREVANCEGEDLKVVGVRALASARRSKWRTETVVRTV
jgi:hypothetical protein